MAFSYIYLAVIDGKPFKARRRKAEALADVKNAAEKSRIYAAKNPPHDNWHPKLEDCGRGHFRLHYTLWFDTDYAPTHFFVRRMRVNT